MAAANHRAQALRFYRPPDPGKEDAPPVARRGVEGSHSIGQELHADCSAVRRLKNLLPTLALESRIALECARDLYLTGGIEVEDGKRLATAYARLKRIAEVVAAAELEVRS
jgi:hypothetical protein